MAVPEAPVYQMFREKFIAYMLEEYNPPDLIIVSKLVWSVWERFNVDKWTDAAINADMEYEYNG